MTAKKTAAKKTTAKKTAAKASAPRVPVAQDAKLVAKLTALRKQGLSYGAIAEKLNMPPSNVRRALGYKQPAQLEAAKKATRKTSARKSTRKTARKAA